MAPPAKTADQTHRRILQAALKCFVRQGYHATTMDNVAAASHTSKGTLYYHFKSKDDLFESAIRSFFETSIGPEALAPMEASPTAAGKLRILAQATLELSEKAEGIFNLFLEFWASSANRQRSADVWLDLLVEYRDIVTGVIEEGVERGEFSPVDAEPLAWALTAAYDGLAAYVMLKPDLDLPRIHRAFIETLLKGLQRDTDTPAEVEP